MSRGRLAGWVCLDVYDGGGREGSGRFFERYVQALSYTCSFYSQLCLFADDKFSTGLLNDMLWRRVPCWNLSL